MTEALEQIETKATLTVAETGEITGMAWPFGTTDLVGDVIEKGAFDRPQSLPMLAEHDSGQTIGVWSEITETPEGLHVKGKLLIHDVPRAREVADQIRQGDLGGLSIAFVTKAAQRHTKGRNITALSLREVSIVKQPCNPGAHVVSLKSIEKESHMENEASQTPANDAPQIDAKAFDAVVQRLDKLEAKGNRLGAPAVVQGDAEQKAFVNYLMTGSEIDKKALTTAADTSNHILMPDEVSNEFIRNLVEFSPVRAISDVRSTGAANIILPKRTGITNAIWVGETTPRTGSQPTFDQSEIAVKELATYVDLSLQLAEDSANVLSEVTTALAEDFGQKESLAFVNGSTALEPSGFMKDANIATTANGSKTALSPDALISLMYALPATYRATGTWVMNGKTLATIRTLKDGHGNYLWQPSYQAGQPETILGRPVVEAVDMPDIAADATPVIFGDFKRGYRIYDRLNVAVLADPYTVRVNGLMRYHARRRVGASVVRPDAFRKLAMAV
ncbi:phage major capsid protein [Paenirhodobacter populi]|uniref:Phage major capsid protein n=1 Tax=Paenirhodobacter populi TaxID=2306993 RepID=A0A443JKU1_9RHOB|nr:phage major capsid protein [Sinirhodobacter populi]RWR21141.1 phage major capsid protein [Sinirhodobacter populi]